MTDIAISACGNLLRAPRIPRCPWQLPQLVKDKRWRWLRGASVGVFLAMALTSVPRPLAIPHLATLSLTIPRLGTTPVGAEWNMADIATRWATGSGVAVGARLGGRVVADHKQPIVGKVVADERGGIVDKIRERYHIAPQAASLVVGKAFAAAKRQHLDPFLLLAVVGVESRFNPYAISKSGAVGLTQTLPSAHRQEIAKLRSNGWTLIDAEANLDMGATILARCLGRSHGNRAAGLQCYNGSSADRERHYSKRVLKLYEDFRPAGATLLAQAR